MPVAWPPADHSDVASQAWSGAGGDYFRDGFYAHGVWSSAALTNASPGLQTLTFRPFLVPVRKRFDRIGVNVTTGAAGATVRLGIYLGDAGIPGDLLLDAGTVDASTAGPKEAEIDVTLDPGVYWLAYVAQGSGTAAVTGYVSNTGTPWTSPSTTPPTAATGAMRVDRGGLVPGALPATNVSPSPSAAIPVVVCLRAAATPAWAGFTAPDDSQEWHDAVAAQARAEAGGDYFRPGWYSHGLFYGQAFQTVSLTSQLAVRPFLVPVRRSFDRIGVNVTSAAAGTLVRFAVYADDRGAPGALLHATPAPGIAAEPAGAKEEVLDLTLDPGVYWLGVGAYGGSVVFTSYAGSTVTPSSPQTGSPPTSVSGMALRDGTTTVPETFASTGFGNAPVVCLRAA